MNNDRPIKSLMVPKPWRSHVNKNNLSVYNAKVGTTDYAEVVSLRAAVYAIPLTSATDPIDSYSTIWLVRAGSVAVGTLRVTYRRNGPLDCERFFPEALLSQYHQVCCSASRFCISPAASRDLRLARMPIETAWYLALQDGIRLDIIDVNHRAVRYYERLGYTVVPNSDFTHPCLGTTSRVMFCAADPRGTGTVARLFADCATPLEQGEIHQVLGQSVFSEPSEREESIATIPPGSIISFSAGTRGPCPDKFRFVHAQSGKFQRLLSQFGWAAKLLRGCPLVVNTYPAPIERMSDAALVDTYTRPSSFSAALMLAAKHQMPIIIVGMPLTVAHLIRMHLRNMHVLPSTAVIMLGGYACPRSLGAYIVECLRKGGCEGGILQLYGVAEIEAGLLAADMSAEEAQPIYYPIDSRWLPEVRNGVLGFRPKQAEEGWIATDEFAVTVGDGFIISQTTSRLEPAIVVELESWGERDWDRRTGAIVTINGRFEMQLREGGFVEQEFEVDYHRFASDHGFSWLDKPNWGKRF